MIDTEEKTEFHVVIVKLGKIEKHPNADSLSLTDVGGYPCIIKTGSFSEGSLAVYVPVDSVVPTDRPEFGFLKRDGKATSRIKAVRLRGIFSMGLLVKVPEEIGLGKIEQELLGLEVADQMGVVKYESPQEQAWERHGVSQAALKNAKKAGGLRLPIYGLDPLRKNIEILQEGEEVVISEKIHGANARFVYKGGRLWVGSHKTMRGATPHKVTEFFNQLFLRIKTFLKIPHRAHLVMRAGDVWWKTAVAYGLKEKLALKPGFVLYGEVYGERVQDLTYDSPIGIRFRAFDVMDLKTKKYLNYDDFIQFIKNIGLDPVKDIVPVLYRGPWTKEIFEKWKLFADTGSSLLSPPGKSPHLIEGFVVKPAIERYDSRCGRVGLKYVGEGYLTRKD